MKQFVILAIFTLVFSSSLFANEPPKMTFTEIQTLASQGNVDAQARLGEAYLNGNYNISPNYTKALFWTKKAAKKGNSRAKLNLGILLINGYAGHYDYAKAKILFEQAEQTKEPKAARYLGILYERGLGVPQDFSKAAYFFKEADKNHDITGQYHLAKLYEQGLGVERNYQKALELYLKHSDRIDHITAPSFIALGDIYALGLGVPKNLNEAEKWYNLAKRASIKTYSNP